MSLLLPPRGLTALATSVRRDLLANIERLLVGRLSHVGSAHPVLDLLRHGQEGLFNIGRVLGRCFEEGDLELISKVLKDEFQADICTPSDKPTLAVW